MNTETNTTKATITELRKFGFIMGGMFALIFGLVFPWLMDKTSESWPIWPFIVMGVFVGLAVVAPKTLRPVDKLWQKIGHVLGFINSRIILGIMFYLLIFPIGLILKVLGKDSMNRKFNEKTDTYRRIVEPRNKKHLEKPF